MASASNQPGFWVTTPSENGQASLSCGGELDMATAHLLRNATNDLTTDVVIDFAAVTFCDSSGIAVLADLQRHLDSIGAGLRVVNVHPDVARAIELCALTEALGVETAQRHAAAE